MTFELLPYLQKYANAPMTKDGTPNDVIVESIKYFNAVMVAGKDQLQQNAPDDDRELNFLLENIFAISVETLMLAGSSPEKLSGVIDAMGDSEIRKFMMLVLCCGIGLSIKEEWR